MNFSVNGKPETTKSILVNDGGSGLSTDEITGALVNIPVVHHEVHEGEMYSVSLTALTIGDNAVIEILLRTGATEYVHLVFFASCGGNAEIELVENPTVNSAGTPMTEYNNKRYSTNAAQTTAFHTPTVVGGTNILDAILAGGTGGNSSGGLLRSGSEFILKPSEDYVIRLTNRAGNNQPGGIIANWYEEGDA